MVSTRSMRSRGVDENAADPGETVNSYNEAPQGNTDASEAARAPRGRRRAPVAAGASRVLGESNGTVLDGLPPKVPTKTAVRTRRAEAEQPAPDGGDELTNAASIPLPAEADMPPAADHAGARQTRRPPRPLLSWQRCLLIVSLAAGVALAIRYRGSWEPPLLAHARTAQAQLHAHYRVHAAELAWSARRAVLAAWGKLQRAFGAEPAGVLLAQEEGKGCAGSLDADALDVIVARGPAWEGLRGTLREVWGGHKEDARKGTGVLLVGASEAATSAAALAVERALPSSCRDCLFVFKAGQLAHGAANAAGAVQKLLAGFLQRCPRGVVVLEGVDQMHPRLLQVWINALSEQGAFEMDGKPVPAWGALYVATMNMADAALDQMDEAALKRSAKSELTARLAAHPAAEAAPAARANAEAFRRRLEFVAPLRQ